MSKSETIIDPEVLKARSAKAALIGAQTKIAEVLKATNDMSSEMEDVSRKMLDLSSQLGDIVVLIISYKNGNQCRNYVSVKEHLQSMAAKLKNASI